MTFCFNILRFQEQMKIFIWTYYVSLIVTSNAEQCKMYNIHVICSFFNGEELYIIDSSFFVVENSSMILLHDY
jgi:hypothetical protein